MIVLTCVRYRCVSGRRQGGVLPELRTPQPQSALSPILLPHAFRRP
jgi:hypothetical protein